MEIITAISVSLICVAAIFIIIGIMKRNHKAPKEDISKKVSTTITTYRQPRPTTYAPNPEKIAVKEWICEYCGKHNPEDKIRCVECKAKRKY